MSSCVALSASDVVYRCVCGNEGSAGNGATDMFGWKFDALTDSNWIVCTCGEVLRVGEHDDDAIMFWSDDHHERMAFWNNRKAVLGPINVWRIVELVSRSIDPVVKAQIMGKAAAHKYEQSLYDIGKWLSIQDKMFLIRSLGIKSMIQYDSIKMKKWKVLSAAISLAKSELRVPNMKKIKVDTSWKSESTESITMVERAATRSTGEKNWIHNPRKTGPKFYDMKKIDKWLCDHNLSMDRGELPEVPDYDPSKLIAQKVHSYQDLNNRQGKLKLEEWASSEDVRIIDDQIVDNLDQDEVLAA